MGMDKTVPRLTDDRYGFTDSEQRDNPKCGHDAQQHVSDSLKQP